MQLFNAFETTAVIFSLRSLTLVLHAGGPLSNETVEVLQGHRFIKLRLPTEHDGSMEP